MAFFPAINMDNERLKEAENPNLGRYANILQLLPTHLALGGKTPAEACGIKVEGDNKWLTLIQNASKKVS